MLCNTWKLLRFFQPKPRNFWTYSGFCFCLFSFLFKFERSDALNNPKYKKDGHSIILDSLAFQLFKVNLQVMKTGVWIIFLLQLIYLFFFFSLLAGPRAVRWPQEVLRLCIDLKFTHGEAVIIVMFFFLWLFLVLRRHLILFVVLGTLARDHMEN